MGQPRVATQSREKRAKNFNEVALGYSKKLTRDEAQRCPQCTDPVCQHACPLGINIPGFIRLLREGNIAGAYEIIRQDSVLPSVCGRICSAPCEVACVLNDEDAPIGIRALERYAADFGRPRKSHRRENNRRGQKIAVIGSGLPGLTAASELAKKGYHVTVLEALDKPGGILRYGIPEFRIPRLILDNEIAEIEALGVEIQTNYFFGKTGTWDELKASGHVALLMALGAGVPKFMNIPGTHLGGVYYGEEFLMRINQHKSGFFMSQKPRFFIGEKVAVVGSGNTALDCARAARRFQREVHLIFRRTEDDMRVGFQERDYAKEENIQLHSMTRPVEIMPSQNSFVDGLRCITMDYADVHGDNQWELTEVAGSEFVMDVDTVILAIGHQPNSFLKEVMEKLQLNGDGTITVDPDSMMTSVEGVFACGNVVTNAGPVVQAMAEGQKAALHMDQYIKGKVHHEA